MGQGISARDLENIGTTSTSTVKPSVKPTSNPTIEPITVVNDMVIDTADTTPIVADSQFSTDAESLEYVCTDQHEEFLFQSVTKRSKVSAEGKLLLSHALLDAERENAKETIVKTQLCNVLNREVFDAQCKNIENLAQENKMLTESLEKYKKLYHELHTQINNLTTEIKSSIDISNVKIP